MFHNNIDTHLILDICLILGLALLQFFFKFINTFLKQTTGLAMGSNVSPLLAEIFMSNLKNSFV